jgi:heme o synthase
VTTPALPAAHTVTSDFLELTKPRITLLVALTALVGFVMATRGTLPPSSLLAAVAGTALVAAGASTLNMLLERDTDARMRRTRNRPLPAGRLRPIDALVFGTLISALGLALLLWLANPLSTAVALVTWAAYLFVYTPLKPLTSLATFVGAVPGALPPMIGWAAARGTLEPGAYILFAILFLWQIPHFLAIAWIYRDDYALGGLRMLPVVDPEGRMTGRQAVANAVALLLVSLAPTFAGMNGGFYLGGAALLGVAYTAAAVNAALRRTQRSARQLFLASVLYLPALSALLLLDRA